MKTTCDWHSDLVNCFRKDITAKKNYCTKYCTNVYLLRSAGNHVLEDMLELIYKNKHNQLFNNRNRFCCQVRLLFVNTSANYASEQYLKCKHANMLPLK